MFKDRIKYCVSAVYGRTSALPYFLSLFVVMIGLALAFTVTVPKEPANAGYPAPHISSNANVQETKRQAILKWMKDNSVMPEQVLSKIYSVAVSSVNPDLILAICLVESNFNPHVESKMGAIGLMGIMPDVWLEELKTQGIVSEQDDLYKISHNINAGIYVLDRYLAKTNSLREALSRYAGGDPAYAAKVLRMLGEISQARRSQEPTYLAALKTGG